MTGADLIVRERLRQISVEGWTPEHDDQHDDMEMSEAALSYLLHAIPHAGVTKFWPWDKAYWKPSSQLRDLVKAGALIAAEIDRLQRLEPAREVDAIPEKGE